MRHAPVRRYARRLRYNPAMATPSVADRTQHFTESVIREMTRLIALHHPDDGINLAQGFPDFPAPDEIKEAAIEAIRGDVNQYSVTWGAPALRAAVADKVARTTGLVVDPDREVTVTCGATEAMIATLLATVNPGDEVVIFQPFYENYWPDTVLAGASPRFVTLHEPDWRIDPDELHAAFGERTRAVIINTPNNPTGKVFSRDELELIGGLCERWNALAITDEIYEHLVYEGEHISLATLPGLHERTVTISGIGKSYSVTGWRVGYAVAPPALTDAIRKVHDFLTVGAPAPLQAAAVAALGQPDAYYRAYLAAYRQRRDYLVGCLRAAGFGCQPPAGAYYIMADISGFDFADDVALAQYLVRERGLAVVPGTSFYPPPTRPDHRRPGRQRVRFSFPKRMETLRRAAARLADLPRRPASATEHTESTE